MDLGDSVLFVHPSAGRALGLFAAGDTRNFFWTTPTLREGGGAATAPGNGWRNWGGDRTWISPEMPLFFPNFPDIHTYEPPPGIDPGAYQCKPQEHGARMAGRCHFRFPGERSSVAIEIEKNWSGAENPLESHPCAHRLQYAGYTLRTLLRRPLSGPPLSLWNIVQLAGGGVVVVATEPGTVAVPYLADATPPGLTVRSRWTEFSPPVGIAKFGFEAKDVTGRMGCLWSEGDDWLLCVRECFVDRDRVYLDAPWGTEGRPSGPACAMQVCSVNNELGWYVELEYHSAALDAGELEDVSRTWAFRGEAADVGLAAELLLGYSDRSRY